MNTKMLREGETKGRNRQQSKTFLKSIVKTEHQSLTSLAFMQLVLGANRVIRHICIWCILFKINWFGKSKAEAKINVHVHVCVENDLMFWLPEYR